MELKTLFQPDDDDRAVSPVIGVILMVAITVILAAVIGTFVLGLGENVETNPSAGVTVDGTNVTLNSLGPNTDGIYCSANPSTKSTEAIGTSIDCSSSNSVVAYRGDSPSNAETEAAIRNLN